MWLTGLYTRAIPSFRPRHIRQQYFPQFIHQWNAHSLPTHMGLLRLWRHCNLWCHTALNRNVSQRQRKQPQVTHHDMLLFAISIDLGYSIFTVDATQDEWMDTVRIKSWQRTSGPCEVIEIGILWPFYTKIRKSGEANGSRRCTRLQKSWWTTPTLDRWHHGMDWDEDQWSGCSSGRSWLLESDTTRRQPFLWRKALNDDDDIHRFKWEIRKPIC